MSKRKSDIQKYLVEKSNQELVDLLRQGVIDEEQLHQSQMSNERVDDILHLLAEGDNACWQQALYEDSIESLVGYLHKYPKGAYAQNCAMLLENKELQMWQMVRENPTKEKLNQYLAIFPMGAHSLECKAMLEDELWLETIEKATLDAYEKYRSVYPERHLEEVLIAIKELSDDKDWAQVCENITAETLQYYVLNHPEGKYVVEAKSIIYAYEHKEELLQKMSQDSNLLSATEIHKYLNWKVFTSEDLCRIFPYKKIESVLSYRSSEELPWANLPEELLEGSTEVYFWGTPSSGKTSAIASIICSAFRQDRLTLWESQGGEYMLKLANLYNNEMCVFSEPTKPECIYEMQCAINDEVGEKHEFSFIDFSGEVVGSLYESQSGLRVSYERELDALKSYVLNPKNKKIHFFVVEYGKHYNEWKGVRMDNHLETCANFLIRDAAFKKVTSAVYVLVTKVDLIQCPEEERAQRAGQYLMEYYPSFYNGLELACQEAEIENFGVIPFSVGDVFAQQLCVFNDSDAKDIIELLIMNTPIIKKKWWNF